MVDEHQGGMTKDAVLQAIQALQVRFVTLWFTDIAGIVKNITIPSGRLEGVIENGLHFDGSALEGFSRVAESDMVLRPDLNTFILLPWHSGEAATARLLCSVHTIQGDPFIGDPRNALVRMLALSEAMGFQLKTGMELEFFVFRRNAEGGLLPLEPLDQMSYFDQSDQVADHLLRQMVSTLTAMGIRVDAAHNEIGAGQHEIDFDYDEALTSADHVLTSRVALRMVAQQNGYYCTFMPRPSMQHPGSGMHTHLSLHAAASGENLLADGSHQYGLSELAQQFLAGQIAHARAMTAVLAPLVNSYKRLATSFEAPKYVTWAHVNRAGEAMIRVPHVTAGKEAHTRIEMRSPDSSANPYLATAVMLAAGLDGIRQKMSLPDAFEGALLRQDRSRLRQLPVLPTSLEEALSIMLQDDVIMDALGAFIGDRYIALKNRELEAYNQQITQWELDYYLSRF